MVECGICFAEYQEGELELHRQLCVVLLVFRCTFCNVDFVSKEGLWNHLDLHEIADESKELHYQEMKAKHKLHQCALCNDQRAYSEIPYSKHVQEAHDGFFLRCFDCGENFRSEKLKNDHELNLCKARLQMVTSGLGVARVDQDFYKVEEMASFAENLKPRLPFPCNSCDLTFSTYKRVRLHKRNEHGRQHKCPHCWRLFQPEELETHLSSCEKKKFTCEICHFKFKFSRYLAKHMNMVHGVKAKLNNEVQDEKIEKCPQCNKKCADAPSLLEHIRKTHKPTTCSVCGITIDGAEKARYHEVSKHTEPEFECSKCSKKFHWKKHWKNHLKICIPNPVAVSSSCNGDLILKDNRESEVARANPASEAPWTVCPHCGKKVPKAVTLAHHIQTYHVPVACDKCGIKLSGLSRAQKHQNNCKKISKKQGQNKVTTMPEGTMSDKTDSSNVPDQYQCTICDITFLNYQQSKYHKLTRHTEEKYQCSYCSKKFHRNKMFQKHLSACPRRTYPCDLCDQKFKAIKYVNEHMIQVVTR